MLLFLCTDAVPNEKLTVREHVTQSAYHPGSRKGPPNRSVHKSQSTEEKANIAQLELSFTNASYAYENAVRDHVLWQLQRKLSGETILDAKQALKYGGLAKAVTDTKTALDTAVNSLLQCTPPQTTELFFRYKGVRQQANRLKDDLIYAQTWQPKKRLETEARYQALCKVEKLLEPIHQQASNPQFLQAALRFLLTQSWRTAESNFCK